MTDEKVIINGVPYDSAAPHDALVAWALVHGPEHLKYAAKRGHVIRAAVVDTMVQMLATALRGRVMRPLDELIKWQPRNHPSVEMMDRHLRVSRAGIAWCKTYELPPDVDFFISGVVRVEEQTNVTDPDSVLKYSGAVITVTVKDLEKRYVLINLEAR